jgi:hypothetical protein
MCGDSEKPSQPLAAALLPPLPLLLLLVIV